MQCELFTITYIFLLTTLLLCQYFYGSYRHQIAGKPRLVNYLPCRKSQYKEISMYLNQSNQPMLSTLNNGNRIIRIKELACLIGLSRSTIYDRLNPKSQRFDPSFPKPVKLGSSAVGWHAGDVAVWINSLSTAN